MLAAVDERQRQMRGPSEQARMEAAYAAGFSAGQQSLLAAADSTQASASPSGDGSPRPLDGSTGRMGSSSFAEVPEELPVQSQYDELPAPPEEALEVDEDASLAQSVAKSPSMVDYQRDNDDGKIAEEIAGDGSGLGEGFDKGRRPSWEGAEERVAGEHDAAVRLQAMARGHAARAEIAAHHDAATSIQAVHRGRVDRIRAEEEKVLYERALAEALAAELQEEKELAAAQATRFLQTMLTHTRSNGDGCSRSGRHIVFILSPGQSSCSCRQ